MSKKIFIIHGWTYSLDKWDKLIDQLKNANYDPVMLKVPGLSQKSTKEWDIEMYVNWLRDNIKNEKDPVIIAHSNGGRISLNYCIKFPNHIKKLILIGSAGVERKGLVIGFKRRIFGTMAAFGKVVTKSKFARKVFYRMIGARDYHDAPENMQATMQNMISSDSRLNISEIKTQSVLIWGEDDDATPLSQGKFLKQNLENSKLHIIKNAKHSPHFTHTDEVMKIIKDEV